MKYVSKVSVNHHYEQVPFSQIDDGIIECQGIILKRLNKRIRNKKLVLEYYKCQNSYTRTKNCGPCKFSGKLVYNVNTKPIYLEIIRKHSLFCSNNEGNKKYLCSHCSSIRENDKKKEVKTLPFEHTVYSNAIPIINISVQVHKEEEINNNIVNE